MLVCAWILPDGYSFIQVTNGVAKLSGKLFIIGTPIGNLEDISMRAISALRECDFILAEDTRVSIKLLNHFEIKKKMLSCHKFNEHERLRLLEEVASQGQELP
jgi:16S rRNA (cytidine1402-2'-O)-methyltransferase